MKVYGAVRRVTLHGEVVFVDGQVLAKPGSGKNISQQIDASSKVKPAVEPLVPESPKPAFKIKSLSANQLQVAPTIIQPTTNNIPEINVIPSSNRVKHTSISVSQNGSRYNYIVSTPLSNFI